ncbi:SDR family oxidoreductase [Telluribacter sp.]|jgi:NAD(P)-dependent dehydrogenase (short-subunit alcohol dehydrogenase family)|uniref:SDR family oxidoreductase n=1 Tax=Telluribacter sp. TaxID=1978767 RepID=UPI002E106BB5|nr:SDR family oxidoreductase [Telluribacter sp.]
MSLVSKVVLITGASSGIGRSTAEYLVGKGYRVFGASRSQPQGALFDWVPMDVTDPTSVQEALAEVWNRAGRLDVVINNAGLGIVGPLEETPDDLLEKVFQTNVFGLLRVCRVSLPYLRRQGGGLIINVSSIAGAMGLPYRGVYSASKSAVEVLTESLSMEVKEQRVRVCSVLPGDIATSINQNRLVANLPPDSVYKASFDKVHQQINQEVSHAADPVIIARAIAEIIEDEQPRLHYMVGPFLQKVSTGLKVVLPQRIFERILLRFYGM